MGTHVVIRAWGERALVAVQRGMREIRRLEGLMNPFTPGSDVARLNCRAGFSSVRISSDT